METNFTTEEKAEQLANIFGTGLVPTDADMQFARKLRAAPVNARMGIAIGYWRNAKDPASVARKATALYIIGETQAMYRMFIGRAFNLMVESPTIFS